MASAAALPALLAAAERPDGGAAAASAAAPVSAAAAAADAAATPEAARTALPAAPSAARRRARAREDRRLDARIADGTMAVAAVRSTLVRVAPQGKTLARLTARSATGRPVRVAAATRRGGWVGVRLSERANDELGWVREEDVRWIPMRTRVDVDLSARRLLLRRDGKVVLRVRVAVGAPGNPTPPGRFGVTDHLRPAPGSGPYGCCILALSGHQTRLPAGWTGGDRLAIHGTTNEGTIGGAVSSGCLRARAADLRVLMRRVPVGATVVVRA